MAPLSRQSRVINALLQQSIPSFVPVNAVIDEKWTAFRFAHIGRVPQAIDHTLQVCVVGELGQVGVVVRTDLGRTTAEEV